MNEKELTAIFERIIDARDSNFSAKLLNAMHEQMQETGRFRGSISTATLIKVLSKTGAKWEKEIEDYVTN